MNKLFYIENLSQTQLANQKPNFDLVIFVNGEVNLSLNTDKETIWATQLQLAKLFDKDKDTIGKHIQNIYEDEELNRE